MSMWLFRGVLMWLGLLQNSGSEANEMVIRLCDLHAGNVTGERKPHVLVLEGCFHGAVGLLPTVDCCLQ